MTSLCQEPSITPVSPVTLCVCIGQRSSAQFVFRDNASAWPQNKAGWLVCEFRGPTGLCLLSAGIIGL